MKIIWILALLHLFCKESSTRSVDPFIIGGVSTTIDKYPYLVGIWSEKKFICGGSLISKNCVLTAAHCVEDYNVTSSPEFTLLFPDFIKAGVTNLTENGTTETVKHIYVSKSYSSKTLHMDVAILILSKAMKGRYIRTLPLCQTGTPQAGQNVIISGWGLTNATGTKVSEQLQTTIVTVDDRDKCQKSYAQMNNLTDTMFCASINGEKDSCSGDSGGPVVLQDSECICGIVSWGNGCAETVYIQILQAARFEII